MQLGCGTGEENVICCVTGILFIYKKYNSVVLFDTLMGYGLIEDLRQKMLPIWNSNAFLVLRLSSAEKGSSYPFYP